MGKTQKQKVSYATKVAGGHEAAKQIAKKVFDTDSLTFEMIVGTYSRAVYFDDDDDVIEDETEEAASRLVLAREWAHDVFGLDTPEATFYAFDQAFDEDGDEDEDEDEDGDEDEEEDEE